MSDPYAPPPVSPSEGRPSGISAEEAEEYFTKLEVEMEADKHDRMARYVPPVLQNAFLEKYPPPPAYTPAPVDDNDIRQAASKRGEPAPNEPKEYVNLMGEPFDPKVLPPEKAAATPPAPSEPVPAPSEPVPAPSEPASV
jgi:hypothetical protein